MTPDRMQAFNLGVVDALLRDWETQLLARYYEIERTPMPDSIYVSAISQLWTFGLYELLRTWRQRARDVLSFAAETTTLPESEAKKRLLVKKKHITSASAEASYAEHHYYDPFEKATVDKKYASSLRKALDHSEIPFRRLESLRVHLAKHEIPRQRGSYGMAPGYGRIDLSTGSFYWQVPLENNEVDIVSRQSLANSCREILSRKRLPTLPAALRKVVKKLHEHHYGIKYVRLTLKDGSTCNAYIAWDSIITHVEGFQGRTFRPTDITEATQYAG